MTMEGMPFSIYTVYYYFFLIIHSMQIDTQLGCRHIGKVRLHYKGMLSHKEANMDEDMTLYDFTEKDQGKSKYV